jgi:DNA-3-methyladenine glycosylase
MYDCLNIVCEPEGMAGCVLIRALEPVSGLDQMRKRRPAARRDEDLANGPGKLTRAMGIKMAHNGVDVTEGPITIHAPEHAKRFEIATSIRIGITKSVDLPLRFFIRGNKFVSKH